MGKKPQKKENHKNKGCDNILGLSTDELAGLSVDEVVNNKPAIKMLIHYYKQLSSENATLKNEKNTLNTYVDAYESKKTNSSIGSLFLVLSNICIAFGVNLLSTSTENNNAGWITLSIGALLAFVGIYYNFFKDKN